MAVSDSMEGGMMDDEEREALEMTRDDVLALPRKRARGASKRPRRLRGRTDLNQRAAAIVAQATEKLEVGFVFVAPSKVEITGARLNEPTITFPAKQPSVKVS
jgi:hypothetical protein